MPGTLELAPKARCVFYCAGALAALTSLMPASALAGPIAVDQGTGDSIRCPSGIVRVAEIEAIIQGDANRSGGQTIGSASVEICADNETKYIDIVTRGAPDEAAGNGSPGRKTGVDGSIQIHGRTARLNANIYVPLTDADFAQCSRQEDAPQDGSCKPHPQVVSFTGTWVFALGKWATFRTGADSAGSPVIVAARVLRGPVE